MQLIILGKNSDDKGTQLEKLTSSILKEEGYTQIRTNVVKSGASEIDITAVFSQQYFGNTLVREVIGECKAYNKPIALPDWLKFLGKVFSEEVNDKQIQGCFIALSGVNGNVTGHYNNIKAKRPDIILLSGESLLDILKTHFEVISIEEILALIPLFTTRRPINYVICYYNERFYWRVTFSENSYTLLSHDGKTLENNDAIKLHQLVTRESDLLKL